MIVNFGKREGKVNAGRGKNNTSNMITYNALAVSCQEQTFFSPWLERACTRWRQRESEKAPPGGMAIPPHFLQDFGHTHTYTHAHACPWCVFQATRSGIRTVQWAMWELAVLTSMTSAGPRNITFISSAEAST